MNNLQDIFNLLTDLTDVDESKGFVVKTNDQMMLLYVSSIARSLILFII